MTSIFRRKGRKGWTVKYRDQYGAWKMRSFPTEWKADEFSKRLKLGLPAGPMPTLKEWAEPWLDDVETLHSRNTAHLYRWAFRKHILPAVGWVHLDGLSRTHVKMIATDLLKSGKSRASVRSVVQALSVCLAAAVDEGLLPRNVAALMRRKLRLAEDPEQQIARSFSLEEAQRFIEALRHEPEHALLLKTMAYTGLRIGETLGLAWGDIDWIAGRFTVARSWQRGKLVNTKTRQQRSVDIPEALLEELRQHDAATKATALAHGESRSPQLFHNDSAVNVRAAFQRVLRKAGLPVHFTPHGLRHTYARLQLEGGASLKYVQQQLGHRTISITADLYGRHADLGSRATADALVARLSPRSADRRIPEQGQER